MPGLQGCDAGFLYSETVDQPITIPFVCILGPRADGGVEGGPLTFERFRSHLAARLPLVPPLRWRLAHAPLGLGRPSFVDDPDFDLDYHLRHVTLPAPGGRAELDRFVAEGTERRLDRRHPLWQLTLVDGLEGGAQALSLRMHHALADGVAIRTMMGVLLADPDADGDAATGPAAVPAPAESAPSGRVGAPALPKPVRRAVRKESFGQWRAIRRLPSLAADTKRRFEAVKAEEEASPIKVPALTVDTPVCSINRAFTAPRVYARTQLALDDVREVKRAAGVTVDAVVLALAAGALRAYLLDHDDLPERPLTANVPISTDPPDGPPRLWGNRFANYLATLATDDPDPWSRLQTIGTVATESRRRLDLLGLDTIVRWLDFVPSAVGDPGGRRLAASRRTHPEKIDFSLLVSNVPGPPSTVAFGPVEVTEMYISGPTTDGEGVNFTAWSYRDRLAISVLAHADALPDAQALVDRVEPALDELRREARQRSAPALDRPDAGARA